MLLVKEELQAKKLKGINVLQEEDLNLNIFFIEKKELKILRSKLKNYFQLKKILDGVMI